MTRIAMLDDDPDAVVRRRPNGGARPQVGFVAARPCAVSRDAAGALPAWMRGAPTWVM